MAQGESRLSRKIIKMINDRGGYAWKQHGNEFMPAGMPDIIGCYKGRFIAIETKMAGGQLKASQIYRARQIRGAGGMMVSPCHSVHEAEVLLDHIDRINQEA